MWFGAPKRASFATNNHVADGADDAIERTDRRESTMKRRADDGVDADASLKARSERAVRETLERKRSKARKDAFDDDANRASTTGVNGDKGTKTTTKTTFSDGMMTFPGRGVDEVARALNVPLPFRRVSTGEGGAVDGVGACGAEAKTNADASDVEEDEWDDVDEYDYGAYVPDVEVEEAVKLEETRELSKAVEEANVGRRKKKVRRLNDEERTALLSTHHAHVLCLVARGRIVRSAASSALLRALLVSCAPRRLVEACATKSSTVEASSLAMLVDWFSNAVAPPISIDDDDDDNGGGGGGGARDVVKDARWRRREFGKAMCRAGKSTRGGVVGVASRLSRVWSQRGRVSMTEEESCAIFASLCQGLGMVCRLVSSLEPVPIRASASRLEAMGAVKSSRLPQVQPLEADGFVRHWCEVLCARHGLEPDAKGNARWVSVVPSKSGSVDAPEIIFGTRKRGTTSDASSSMPYVLAFYGDSGARDVTRKYAIAFSQALHHRTPDWKWWEKVTKHVETLHRNGIARDASPELRKLIEAADAAELFEMDTRSSKERVPGTMTEIKNHPLWVVERFLTKSQCIHPRHPVKGLIAGEPVFPRSCVKELKSAERWKSECRRRVLDELLESPVRKIHSRASQARIKALTRARDGWFMTQAEGSKERLESEEWRIEMASRDDCPADPARMPGDIALYGEWQTEPWTPPAAVGGLVPKNDRGNVDLYGNALPPPGTVHINFPRIYKTAKTMQIDYAPALVGFEYKAGGKTLPVFNGIVVCEEFKDELLKRHEEAEEVRKAAIEAKMYREACLKWRLLLGAIWTRRRLRDEFQKDSQPELDPTAARIAAAKKLNEASQVNDDAPSQPVAVEPLTLGATAFVEEL